MKRKNDQVKLVEIEFEAKRITLCVNNKLFFV